MRARTENMYCTCRSGVLEEEKKVNTIKQSALLYQEAKSNAVSGKARCLHTCRSPGKCIFCSVMRLSVSVCSHVPSKFGL